VVLDWPSLTPLGTMYVYFQDKQDTKKPTVQPPSLENQHAVQNEAALKSFCTSPPWDPYKVLPYTLTMMVLTVVLAWFECNCVFVPHLECSVSFQI